LVSWLTSDKLGSPEEIQGFHLLDKGLHNSDLENEMERVWKVEIPGVLKEM